MGLHSHMFGVLCAVKAEQVLAKMELVNAFKAGLPAVAKFKRSPQEFSVMLESPHVSGLAFALGEHVVPFQGPPGMVPPTEDEHEPAIATLCMDVARVLRNAWVAYLTSTLTTAGLASPISLLQTYIEHPTTTSLDSLKTWGVGQSFADAEFKLAVGIKLSADGKRLALFDFFDTLPMYSRILEVGGIFEAFLHDVALCHLKFVVGVGVGPL